MCRARQLRYLGVYLVPLSAYVHTCMDLPGMPGISDRDGLLTVLGTSIGRDFSFFLWSHFFSLYWVGTRSLDAFYFLSFVREATFGSFASNRQHCSALDLTCSVFCYRNTPESFASALFSCSIVGHLGEMTYHNIRLQEHTSCMTLTPTSISRLDPPFYFSCRMSSR